MTALTGHRRRTALLRAHAWVVVLAVVVTVGSACAFALTRPTSYVALAQVSVGPEQAGGTALRPEMASERAIVLSGAVASDAAAVLGREPQQAERGLTVSVVIESSILNIRYTAAGPEAAGAGARAFAQSYVDYRNNVATTRIARVVTWPDTVQRSGVSLVFDLAVALVAGVVLGVGAAWARDRLADRIRHPGELADRSGLPVLGELPGWKPAGHLAPPGAARAAFSYLATRLGSMVSQRHTDLVVVVTSPRVGAGATTVALNTALAFAAQEREVVLVGADLHHPGMHEVLGLPPGPGLLEVLAAECTLEEALRRARWANLSVLAVGATADADQASLQPDLLGLVLRQLSSHAIVVVDAPPLLEAADSLLLVDHADVLLVVGDLRSGRRRDVDQAIGLTEGARPAVSGWVANLPRRITRRRRRDRAPVETTAVADSVEDAPARPDRVAS